MDEVDFTDDEIRKELADLGYKNIPPERFLQFKRELYGLILQERSHNGSVTSSDNSLTCPDRSHHRDKENEVEANSHVDSKSCGDGNGATSVQPASARLFRSESDRGQTLVKEIPRGLEEPRQGVMKRKVLRKVDGQTTISESFTESEADDVAELQERLHNASLQRQPHRPMSAPPDIRRPVSGCDRHSDHPQQHRPHTACREPMSYNLPEDYSGPKAVIRPMSCDPHVRNIKKTDPVARYQAYQHSWTANRAPGEKAHKQLRWGVREKMLYHDQVVEKKQPRVYHPNTYVVPSDKKRKTLRWQVRMDLAQGVKPHSVFDD